MLSRRSIAALVAVMMLAGAPGLGLAAGAETGTQPAGKAQPRAAVTGSGLTDHDTPTPPSPRGNVRIESYTGNSDPTIDSDEEFVIDSYGSQLDEYLYRESSPILFPIPIDRYFGAVDENGHLLHPENIAGGRAQLTLRVWDVDQNATGYPPEVDNVYINDYYVGSLTGSNEQWSTFTVDVPLNEVIFPAMNGANTAPVPASNWVKVDIDTACGSCWAVEVDWGRLTVQGIRPALLVHGFWSSGEMWSTWLNEYAPEIGLPVHELTFEENTGSFIDHMMEISAEIDLMEQQFGVNKVNIVAHSKGGIDSRAYLTLGRSGVDTLIMIGTPNCGSPLANILKAGKAVPGVFSNKIGNIGEPAVTELMPAYMEWANESFFMENPLTKYYTIAGDWDNGGLVEGAIYIWGPDDGVVAVSSVECIDYTTSLGHTTDWHTDEGQSRAAFDLASPYLRPTVGSLAVKTENVVRPMSEPSAATGAFLNALDRYTITTGETQTRDITVEGGTSATVGVIWGLGKLDVSLTSPSGTVLSDGMGGVRVRRQTDDAFGVTWQFYQLESPEVGVYHFTVSTAETGSLDYLVAGQTTDERSLIPSVNTGNQAVPGAPVTLEAVMNWGGAVPLPMAVVARLLTPDGTKAELTMTDDGTNGDAVAADGCFTATFQPAAEGFYMASMEAASTHPAEPLRRIATTGFQVLSAVDRFTNAFSARGRDQDSNGLYEDLAVTAGVSISTPGTYQVVGELTDTQGHSVAVTSSQGVLAAGSANIVLVFSGEQLGDSDFSGDLILTHLSLVRADGSLADLKAQAATFSGYDASQFRLYPLRVLKGITDEGIDSNGNGHIDQLVITVPVQISTPGRYEVNARLMDGSSGEIEWYGTSVNLPAGAAAVQLLYTGELIGSHGQNGPYLVRDFSLYCGSLGINIANLYTTQAYQVSQFERAGDIQPPTTMAQVTPQANAVGWNNTPVQVSLVATDDASGVAGTEYNLDGAGWLSYSSPVVIEAEGTHSLSFYSVDAAANREPVQSLTLRVDMAGPALTVSSPLPNQVSLLKPLTPQVQATDLQDSNPSVTATLDGHPLAWGAPVSDYGAHDLVVTAVDMAGNVTQKSIAFTVADRVMYATYLRGLVNDLSAQILNSPVVADKSQLLARLEEANRRLKIAEGGLRQGGSNPSSHLRAASLQIQLFKNQLSAMDAKPLQSMKWMEGANTIVKGLSALLTTL